MARSRGRPSVSQMVPLPVTGMRSRLYRLGNEAQISLGFRGHLGSGLIDQSQKMTIAAMEIADMKVWAQRS